MDKVAFCPFQALTRAQASAPLRLFRSLFLAYLGFFTHRVCRGSLEQTGPEEPVAHSASELGENELIDNNLGPPEEIKHLAHGLGHLRVTGAEHLRPGCEWVSVL